MRLRDGDRCRSHDAVFAFMMKLPMWSRRSSTRGESEPPVLKHSVLAWKAASCSCRLAGQSPAAAVRCMTLCAQFVPCIPNFLEQRLRLVLLLVGAPYGFDPAEMIERRMYLPRTMSR